MGTKQSDSRISRKTRKSLNGRILRHTTLNILILVAVCCVIMALSMQSLANSILLDSLQPMARQSAKTVEANIRILAERMMMLAGDSRMNIVDIGGNVTESGHDGKTAADGWEAVLTEAAEIYEFYTIALYDLNGNLLQGIEDAPKTLDSDFFALLQETDNLTIDTSTRFRDELGITMGMPVKEGGDTALYVVGVYKYDTLNDVIANINLGRHGMAYMVNHAGVVAGHPEQDMVLSETTMEQLCGGNQEAVSRVTSDETGAAEFAVEGETMLVAFSPVRGTSWSLVIQVPKADYGSYINGAMLVAVSATFVVLVLSILVVLRLSRSISRPVKNVTERMVDVSKVDPKNCDTAELYAFTANLKESGKGSFEDTVLKAVVAKTVKDRESAGGSFHFSEKTDWTKIVKDIMDSEYCYGDLKGYMEWKQFLDYLTEER